ncbi:MAG: molybdopterin-dependent oxidoreductase [Methylophaga sp.]|nr:molybdopterin-dependent oxidoreductase [Methylophaga sp.]
MSGNMTEPVATTCPYCGVGCGVLATPEKDGSLTIKGLEDHPANFGRLCSKGSALGDTVDLDGRLLHPQIKGQQSSWDEALDAVANGFRKVIDEHGPDAVAFYVSGQLLTEDYYVANKLMKGFIGSGNIDTNSRLCMSSAVAGYKRAFGADAVPCSYEDLEQADLIVIEGSNTAWCHPVIFQRIVQAKEDNPDLKIVVIDPRKTATCEIADLHLPLKSGSDTSLFNGLLHYLQHNNHLDNDFIDNHTEGFAAALSSAQQSSADINTVAERCGLSANDVAEFFRLFANTEKVVTLYSQGVNQSSAGTDNSNSIINCHLATGRIGKPAMGPFSITGQPNAMGGREVGGLSNQLAAHMDIDNPIHHDLVSRFWQTDNLTTTAGAKAVDMFNDVASGKIKAIWIMATNPVVTLPDADKVREALQACELVVVSDCEQNTDTTACSDILLPALAWGEKCGTVTNSERRISRQRNILPHPGEAEEDWWIICHVAQRLGFEKQFDYPTNADIFREHAALSSFENNGTRDFDISALAKISDDEYDQLTPIQWPINADNPNGTERLFTDKCFFTASGKAQFIAIQPRLPVNTPNEKYPLILNTGRVRDQWHTMTRTARSAKLNGHIPEPFVEVHPVDAEKWSVIEGALAQIESRWGAVLARVQVTDNQQKGSVFIPMHWNQQNSSLSRVDAVVNPAADPLSGQPEFKHTPVSIRAYQPVWHGFILSRIPLPTINCQYWLKIKGEQFWRYELAGDAAINDHSAWAKQHLGDAGEWLEFSDGASQRYRAGIIKNNQLESVVFIAPTHELPTRSWLSQLFAEKELSSEARTNLLAGKPGADQPDIGPLICACFGVGENTIKEAIACGDAKTVDDIGNLLKAGTNCGSCIPELKKLLYATAK